MQMEVICWVTTLAAKAEMVGSPIYSKWWEYVRLSRFGSQKGLQMSISIQGLGTEGTPGECSIIKEHFKRNGQQLRQAKCRQRKMSTTLTIR